MSPELHLTEIEPQLKRMKFRGSYYSYSPVPFVGTATIDLSTGQFSGTIEDAGQIADIVGEKHETYLCFVKLYRKNKDGYSVNDEPINYEFRGFGADWSGFFEYGIGQMQERDDSRLQIYSVENSLMSPGEFKQVTEEVSGLIGARRTELARRWREIEELSDEDE